MRALTVNPYCIYRSGKGSFFVFLTSYTLEGVKYLQERYRDTTCLSSPFKSKNPNRFILRKSVVGIGFEWDERWKVDRVPNQG